MPEYLETTIDKFIFRVATDRLYSSEGVGRRKVIGCAVGLTDYLQQRGGDVAFVHVKPVGTKLAAATSLRSLRRSKPTRVSSRRLAGRSSKSTQTSASAPEIINEDPYGKGWLAVIEAADWESRSGEVARSRRLIFPRCGRRPNRS